MLTSLKSVMENRLTKRTTLTFILVLEHQFLTDMADRKQREVRFHHVFDSSIMMIEGCTVAVKQNESRYGIFFMNLPMVVGEEIFIHRKVFRYCGIKFGLTNKDPNHIRLQDERENILREVKELICPSMKDSFNACISLGKNGLLEFIVRFCDCYDHILSFANLATNDPIWLVFVLPDEGQFVQISKQIINTPFKDHLPIHNVCNPHLWVS